MEFVSTIRKTRNRKRKKNVKNKRRDKRKLEVKGTTRRKATFSHNTTFIRDELLAQTMEAHTFWENYTVAQDWQRRHSVAWWRSRCHALEHENQILRQKVRSQASDRKTQATSWRMDNRQKFSSTENNVDSEVTEKVVDDDETFEFEVDKEMLDFLEQSIRHKMELKRSRESAIKTDSEEAANSEEPFVSGEARMRAKTEDARLLYGESSSRIMAMEAALQATMDRHRDRAKPHYWPNIPLKP